MPRLPPDVTVDLYVQYTNFTALSQPFTELFYL